MKQKYLADIESYADGVPYGDVQVKITRVNRRVTKTQLTATETLRYRDNQEALDDINVFLQGLVDVGHTGEVQFQVVIENGQIKLLAITNTRETSYEKDNR